MSEAFERKPAGDRSGGDRKEGRGGAGAGGPRRTFFKRRKTCRFSGKNAPAIDYKDVKLLSSFVSESGKMTPSRITAVSRKAQRRLSQAIKRARFLALMPYVAK